MLAYDALFKNLDFGPGAAVAVSAALLVLLGCLAVPAGVPGPGRDRKEPDMRNRKRVGWHRYINGVNIATFVIVLFIGTAAVLADRLQLQDAANRSASARRRY